MGDPGDDRRAAGDGDHRPEDREEILTVLSLDWPPGGNVFSEAGCGPCRMVAPVLEELSRELAGRLKVVKVHADSNPRLASQFDARSIPMLAPMVDGEVRQKVVGA